MYWKINKDNEVTGMVKRQTRHVGRNISTKAVGSNQREDVTSQYKFPEGGKKLKLKFALDFCVIQIYLLDHRKMVRLRFSKERLVVTEFKVNRRNFI